MLKAKGLEYEEHGHGEAVLLIHGAFISDALSLIACEAALTERNRVIWYRRRGYGGSDPVSAPFSIAEQAGDAQALLEHLGVEWAHVVGHSGGGVIATELALQAPQLVRSLVVLEPAIMPPPIVAAFPEMLAPASTEPSLLKSTVTMSPSNPDSLETHTKTTMSPAGTAFTTSSVLR